MRLHTEGEAAAVQLCLRVVSFAQTVRFIPVSDESGTDLNTFLEAVASLAHHGVDRNFNTPHSALADELSRRAAAVLAALDESPIPEAEWSPMADILGDQLPRLLSISASSAARYRSGERATPDRVAARLHVVTQIVSDLSGSYNDFGIRRWFERPRQVLDGRAPAQILTGDWSPTERDVRNVRDLAQTLLGAVQG